MKKLIDLIQEELVKAFTAAEMDPSYARVSVSNRPDLCEYQCNGAMAAAKAYHKAPIQLAEAVVEKVTDHSVIGEIEAVKPGFINLKINPEFLADYLSKMQNDEDLSVEKAKNPKTIIVDYGEQTWQNRFTSAISVPRSSARASSVWDASWGTT